MNPINISDAVRRASVQLPDGSVGTLFAVNKRTGKSKVRVDGKWLIVLTDSLERNVIHLAGLDQKLSCCGRELAAIKHRHTTTTDPRLTTCRDFARNAPDPRPGTNPLPPTPETLSGDSRGLSGPVADGVLPPKRTPGPTGQSARSIPSESVAHASHDSFS